MPVATGDFRPAWWLPGPHLQTIFPTLFRRRPLLDLSWHRLELADGDFLDLCWPREARGPVVVIVHGLEGGLDSHYAGNTMAALAEAGFLPLFMHLRGCSGAPNRLDRSYHSGDTGDLAAVVAASTTLFERPAAAAIGFSLGGNQLLKWLGENGDRSPLRAAVAVSVPFRLADAAQRLERGASRIYQAYLLAKMRASYRRRFRYRPSPLGVDVVRLRTFRAFDDAVTAPLHGFAGVDDYYRRASCRPLLGAIRRPTLILHAQDDPFMYPQTMPSTNELAAGVVLECTPRGGHVGFVGGAVPGRPDYWLDRRICRFLSEQLTADIALTNRAVQTI